jgi:hypothetical protein
VCCWINEIRLGKTDLSTTASPVLVMDATHVDIIQKAARVELAQGMLEELAKHERTEFHFLLTGDESWMFSAHDRRMM